MAADWSQLKSLRGFIVFVAFVFSITGSIMVGSSYTVAWLSVCGVFGTLLTVAYMVTNQTSYMVIATGLLLMLSGFYIQYAKTWADLRYNNQKVLGYTFLISALGFAFLASATNFGFGILRQLSLSSHAAALVIFILNLAGVIVMLLQTWASDYGKSIGIPALINGFIFLVGVVHSSFSSASSSSSGQRDGTASVATWINIFFSAYQQMSWLGVVIPYTSSSKTAPAAPIIGMVLIWLACVFFIAYNIYHMSGSNVSEVTGAMRTTITTPRGIIIIVCIIASIVSAFTFKDTSKYTNWIMANCIFVPIFFFVALLNSGERRYGWAMVAFAMTIYNTDVLVPNIDMLHKYGYNTKTNESVLIVFLICNWISSLVYGINDHVRRVSFSTRINNFRLFALLIGFIGLVLWWRFDDKSNSIQTLSMSIGAFMAYVFFIGATWFTPLVHAQSVAAMLIAMQSIIQLGLGLTAADVKHSYGPYVPSYVDQGEAGACMCFSASILLLIAYVYERSTSNDDANIYQDTVYQPQHEGYGSSSGDGEGQPSGAYHA